MQQVTFYLDFAAPAAYLVFERLPGVLQGLSYAIRYQPVRQSAPYGPEGEPCALPAQRAGIPFRAPYPHPFDSRPLLRLAWACARHGAPNRYVVEAIFRAVWAGPDPAAVPALPDRLRSLLQPRHDPGAPAVRAALERAESGARAAGAAKNLPAFVAGDRVVTGPDMDDVLVRLRGHLQGAG